VQDGARWCAESKDAALPPSGVIFSCPCCSSANDSRIRLTVQLLYLGCLMNKSALSARQTDKLLGLQAAILRCRFFLHSRCPRCGIRPAGCLSSAAAADMFGVSPRTPRVSMSGSLGPVTKSPRLESTIYERNTPVNARPASCARDLVVTPMSRWRRTGSLVRQDLRALGRAAQHLTPAATLSCDTHTACDLSTQDRPARGQMGCIVPKRLRQPR